jgi:hypothetical protein
MYQAEMYQTEMYQTVGSKSMIATKGVYFNFVARTQSAGDFSVVKRRCNRRKFPGAYPATEQKYTPTKATGCTM